MGRLLLEPHSTMPGRGVALGERLLEEGAPRSVRRSWRAALLVGVALTTLVCQAPWSRDPAALSMAAWRNGLQQVRSRTDQVPRGASHFVPPFLQTATRISQLTPLERQPAIRATADGAKIQAQSIAEPVPEINKEDITVEDKAPAPVGLTENEHFTVDESVLFWKDYQRPSSASPLENFREAASILQSIASEGPQGQQYALAHGLLRMGYFATNAVLGTGAFALRQFFGGQDTDSETTDGMSDEGGLLSGGLDTALGFLSGLVLESALCFRQDFRQISQGYYKAPWDMSTPNHRQFTPQYAADKTLRFVNEAMGTLDRRVREKPPGIWLESPLYPQYYLNDFHYQTDGWMAPDSSKVYETSTETLFLGRQDSMQRLSLVPLHDMANANGGKPRILEVAAGTGRFATFIRDNHPSANVTLVDLSPFYLEAARENDEYWRETRYPNKATRPGPATFVQAAAEKLPFADGSFDAVVCVYLFHEMPAEARAAAAAEMARVAAPGGMVVLTDSYQRGDRISLTKQVAKAFGKLNEPHYEDYVDTYLPSLFTASGLTCDRKLVESATKCISFRKPEVSTEAGKGTS